MIYTTVLLEEQTVFDDRTPEDPQRLYLAASSFARCSNGTTQVDRHG